MRTHIEKAKVAVLKIIVSFNGSHWSILRSCLACSYLHVTQCIALTLQQYLLHGLFCQSAESTHHPAYCANITEVPVGLMLQECFARVLKGHITLCIVLTYMRNTCWVDVTGVFYQSAERTHHPVYCANIHEEYLLGWCYRSVLPECWKDTSNLCIALTLQEYLLGWCYRSVLPECWKDTSPCVLC